MQAINAFIIGYHNATAEMFGGHSLQLLSLDDWFGCLKSEVTLVGIPHSHWSCSTINILFDLKVPHVGLGGMSLDGELADLPSEKLNEILQTIGRLNEFYFYELAFESKAKSVSGDYIGALLLAVAALEGAHGAFVSSAIDSRLSPSRTGEDKNLEEDFLTKLGFSKCNKLTPYLFMDTPDRPSDDLIQNVAIAVKYRNEIMHALRNSKGEYKIRLRTNAELMEAASAARKLYDVYRAAVEKLASKNGG